MLYVKRILQALFVLAIIWLTYTNADQTVNLNFFTKEVHDASVVIVVVLSLFTGALVASFFSVIRELRTTKKYRETDKENIRLKKELDDATRDLRLANIDLESLKAENGSFKKLIEVANTNKSTGVIL